MIYETYRTTPSVNGKGTFFFTDCGNRMYSVNDAMAYHGRLCPKCFYNGKHVTLYMRGTDEANNLFDSGYKPSLTEDRYKELLDA